jgi:hypothetical protein
MTNGCILNAPEPVSMSAARSVKPRGVTAVRSRRAVLTPPKWRYTGVIRQRAVTCQQPFRRLQCGMIDAAEFVGGNPSLDFVNTIGGIR